MFIELEVYRTSPRPSDLRRFGGEHDALTDITRDDYAREAVRYASDLSVAEWVAIVPLMPDPKPVGRPRKADLRDV